MKFGLSYELQCPKPLDSDQWHPGDGQKVIMEALERIEFADKLGLDYVFEVEHDFLEEYAHSSAPEDGSALSLYRASQRGGFMGSPGFIRENLRLYEAAHVDMDLFIAQSGDRPHEDIMASMEFFTKEVMLEFQDRLHLHQRWRKQQLQGVIHPVNSSI